MESLTTILLKSVSILRKREAAATREADRMEDARKEKNGESHNIYITYIKKIYFLVSKDKIYTCTNTSCLFLVACYLIIRLRMEMTHTRWSRLYSNVDAGQKLFRINCEIPRICAAAFHAVRAPRTNNRRPITGGPRACLSCPCGSPCVPV